MFAVAVGCLYVLALRLVAPTSALLAAALFATQPLLFGHAFINQKDIPFMTMFLLTIVVGLLPGDRHRVERDTRLGLPALKAAVREDWSQKSRPTRVAVAAILLTIVLLHVMLFQGSLGLAQLERVLTDAYSGQGSLLAGWIFERVATLGSAVPLDAYLRELRLVYVQARLLAVVASAIAFLLLLAHQFPRTRGLLRSTWRGRELQFLAAGVLLGAAMSMREIGVLAGLLVSLDFMRQVQPRDYPWLLYLWGISLIVMYLVWPALWGHPFDELSDRFLAAASFPQVHTIFYLGELVFSNDLPWHYVPWLATIQMTEGLVVCLILAVASLMLKRNWLKRAWLVGILLWIGIPVFAVIVLGVPIYGNIRHLLFGVPALFLLAAIGIDSLLAWIRRPSLAMILAIGLLAPGVLGIMTGHPYEYIYYNSLVGGVRGASGRHEMDHWCISMKEAVGFLNEYAVQDSDVSVEGAIEVARGYAREDLDLYRAHTSQPKPDYGLACDNLLDRPEFFEGLAVVHEVTSRGVVLAQVLEAQD
jgi:hypothetical protein